MTTGIDWAIVSKIVVPYIETLGKSLGKKLLEKGEDAALAPLYAQLLPNEKLQRANREFVTCFTKELDKAIILRTLNAPQYDESLSTLLCNPTVQDAIRRPLDGESEFDWALLGGIWTELKKPDGSNLMALPSTFEWSHVGCTYQNAVQKLIPSTPDMRKLLAALGRLAPPSEPIDFKRYSTELTEAYGYLSLGSMGADWTTYESGISLLLVYVPQGVKQALPPRVLTRDYLRQLSDDNRLYDVERAPAALEQRVDEYSQLRVSGVLEVIDEPSSSRLVILGDPGSGKSTLLRYLAVRFASGIDDRTVFIIELRRSSGSPGQGDFLDYLETSRERLCSLPRTGLVAHLSQNSSFVLFDGLDEVPESLRPETVQSIIRFSNDFPKARVIVTTRIYGYHPGSRHSQMFSDARFSQYTLQDFDQDEIERFIACWHKEVFRDLEERDFHETRLRNAIDQAGALRELSTSPLLLTLIAVLNRNGRLPLSRVDLYERCAELLLEHWDLEKFPEMKERTTGTHHIIYRLSSTQKMRTLERVAASMQKEPQGLSANLISEEALENIVAGELARLGVGEPFLVANDLVWMLRERNFMLGYVGDRQYAFLHRTFLEFFCARELKDRPADLESVFREKWTTEAWHEVLRLVCGLIGAGQAGKCIQVLLDQCGEPDGYKAVFLAAQCLAEVRQIARISRVRRAALAACKALLKFDFPYYYDELGSEERSRVPRIREQAVREIARGWKDDPETPPFLKALATFDEYSPIRSAAVEELARGWRSDPGTLPLLMDRIAHDGFWAVRNTAVTSFARGWSDEPNTLEWLKEHVECDENWGVRLAAVRELARRWKDERVRRLLFDRAAKDGDDQVRAAAALEIAKHWKDHADTLTLLKKHIQKGDDFGNGDRSSVVRELVQGWREVPELKEWLKRQAIIDPDPEFRKQTIRDIGRGWRDAVTEQWLSSHAHDADDFVRWSAARSLARWWKYAAGTLALLKEIATHDVNSDIRQAALRELAQGWRDRLEILTLLRDRAEHDDDYSVRYVAVQQVARCWTDAPDTLEWLRARAIHDESASVRRWAALREVAYGWREDGETVAWLKERASGDEDWIVRQGAIQELAIGWRNDPAVILWMKDLVANATDWACRAAALRELARNADVHSEITNLLEAHAGGDQDARVRKEGLRSLARRFRGDSGVGAWLRIRATEDQDVTVRLDAVKELARGWKEDAQTLVLLMATASEDPSEELREAAIRILANDWKNPEALAALKRSANEDRHWKVRAAAMSELTDKWRGDATVESFLKGMEWPHPPATE